MGVELLAGRRPKGQSRSVPVDGWTKKKTPRGAEPDSIITINNSENYIYFSLILYLLLSTELVFFCRY